MPKITRAISLKTYATDWVLDAANRLESLGSLRQGWDSYGGTPLKPQAKSFAFSVLGWLEQHELPRPSVVLGSDGTVQLEWRSMGREFDLNLGEGDAIGSVRVDLNGEIEDRLLTSNLPENVRNLARWLLEG